MNFNSVWIVFKKEVKDIARDKKTLITNLIVPIILMPLLFLLMGGGMKRMERDIVENITVALASTSDTQDIRDLVNNDIFGDNPNIKLTEDSVDDPVDAIRNGDVRFVLEVEENYAENLEAKVPYTITITYDQSDTKSSGSYGFLVNAIELYNQRVVQSRLVEMDIDTDILEPVRIIPADASEENGTDNLMLMMILPMLISILMAVGGVPAATDLIAGEKERATLEPLLTTQAGRGSILLGKYLTVTLFSVVSVIAQFIGVVIGSIISPGFLSMGESAGELSFFIPPAALFLTVLITITLGMVFAGIQLAISTYAKSFKEAQTYLSYLIFVAMVPAYATMMMQPDELKLYMFFVPLLNAIASLKMVLGNVINYSYLGIALGVSIIYVFLSLAFARSMFNKEKVLFRS